MENLRNEWELLLFSSSMTQVCGLLRLCSVLSTLPKTIRRLIHIEERKSLPIGIYYLVTQNISIEKQW